MLTSSAVGGRRAAPRAPPRRREAPKTTEPPASNTPSTDPSTAKTGETAVEQPVLTARNEDVGEERRAPPSPPVVVERPLTESIGHAGDYSHTQSTIGAQDNPAIALPTTAGHPSASFVSSTRGDGQQPHEPARGTKRTNEASQNHGAPVTKRVRVTRSSQPSRDNTTQRGNLVDSVAQSHSTSVANNGNLTSPAETEHPQPPTRRRVASRKAQDTVTAVARTTRARNDTIPTQIASSAEHSITATSNTTPSAANDIPVSSNQPKPVRQRRNKKGVERDIPTTTDSSGTNAEAPFVDNTSKSAEDSDRENHRIDPVTLSMYDLSHDSKHGKTSEREKKMSKIDWREVARKRRDEADAIMKGELQPDQEGQTAVQSTEGEDFIAQSADTPTAGLQDDAGSSSEQPTSRPEPITRPSGAGVRFRIVGGQLVEDEASLTIDRAARVVQAAADTDEPVEEENDLTTRFNRTTYINARKRDPTERVPLWRSKSDAWTEEETDRFYEALRMFGTDFFIISKMFTPRTRKQIKLKFVREERLEPDRVNAALLGRHTRRIDLDHYAQAINRDVNDFHKYDGLEHANEVIRASMKDKEEAMRAAVKEDEENNRQREAQRQQREKQRLEAEKKREERAKKKAMSRHGDIWGAGTLGGADDDNDED